MRRVLGTGGGGGAFVAVGGFVVAVVGCFRVRVVVFGFVGRVVCMVVVVVGLVVGVCRCGFVGLVGCCPATIKITP